MSQDFYAYITNKVTSDDLKEIYKKMSEDFNKLYFSEEYTIGKDISWESGFELKQFPNKNNKMYKAIRFDNSSDEYKLNMSDGVIEKIKFNVCCCGDAPKWTYEEYNIIFTNMQKIGILCVLISD